MAVRSISIEGFKSIARVKDLELRPLNVLIGANGSGKSNFIGAFELLRAVVQRRLDRYVAQEGGADRVLHFGARTTPGLKIQAKLESAREKNPLLPIPELYTLNVELSGDSTDRLRDRAEYESKGPRPAGGDALPRRHGDAILGMQPYHFHDTGAHSPLKKTADLHNNRELRPDASNLAAYLYFLREKHNDDYGYIRKTVGLAAPFFEDFMLEPMALNDARIRLEWRHRGSDAYFDVSSLSDGTLRFMALATLLLQPASLRPPTILLDEPELGLHPYAIALLASMLKKAATETQIVLATQSPRLVDRFDPEDIVVAERVEGATGFRRLDPEPLGAWLEDYSLGELWEKNEFGGRPAPENRSPAAAR